MRIRKDKIVIEKMVAMGLPGSIEEARRIVISKRFYSKHPVPAGPIDELLLAHQFSFEEFKARYSEIALRCSEYRSVKRAYEMLRAWYMRKIVDAVKEDRQGISVDGLDMVRFRWDTRHLVKEYCRRNKINLD